MKGQAMKACMLNSTLISMMLGVPSIALAAKNTLSISYSCLSLDGVPISNDTDLSSKCCKDGALVSTPPEDCRVGFSGAAPAALGLGVTSLNIAQSLLQSAATMSAVSGNLETQSSGSGVTGNPSSQSSALVQREGSGSGSGKRPSDAGASVPGMGGSGTSGGSGAGSAGAGLMGAAAGLGASAAGVGPTNGLDRAGGVDSYSGGLYASKGPAGAAGSNGASGHGVTPNDGKVEMLDLGGPSSVAAGAGPAGDELTGSREDAVDYLSRIDRNVSIFKVVSRRYEREITRNRVRALEVK